MQVSIELINFFYDPLCVGVALDMQLLILQMQKVIQLAINMAKNYGGVLVRYTWFTVLFLQTY